MSDSSIIGYLTPTSTGGELNDDALTDFMQSVVVGITGMNGELVRPGWQPEPPNIPPFGTDWAGVAVSSRKPDTFTYTTHRSEGGGFDETYRQEILEILVSFYGPHCEGNAELFSVGLQVAQNLEAMKLQGFGFVDSDDPLTTGDFVNQRWIRRVDLAFRVRRPQIYTYPVDNLLGAQLTVQTDSGVVDPATVNIHTVVKLPLFAWDVEASSMAGWDQGSWR